MPHLQDYTTRREACIAWLTANGIEVNQIPCDADLYIDDAPDGTRHIHYEAFHLTSDGRKQMDERGENVAMERRTTPLLVEPLDWWEPYRKPTRDELLAVLGRVQQLAERWKHTGDRKGGPRQELLRALGEDATREAP